jgi:ABC-type phosphate transport system substrate-binding protein
MKKIVGIFLVCFSLLTPSFAEEYAVIANKKIAKLSLVQIKAIFLKKIRVINGVSVVPINLKAKDPLRVAFEKELLHMSFSRLKKYWIKEHYLGHRPPLTLHSQESVKAFVKRVDGAIAYINVKYLDESMKILYRWKE